MTSRRAATLIAMLMSAVANIVPATASAQILPESGCADCHFAEPKAPRRDHLEAWDRSPHARERVGCEQCHGGNPRTFEGFLAHARVIPGVDDHSPVNRRNLPATCGRCHTGAMLAFQRSRHYELLQSGNPDGPSCATCHGDVEGRVLSAKALGSQCNECHGTRELAPRAERARAVREEYDALRAVRDQMKLARTLIKHVDDKNRRALLDEAYQQAEVPLKLAVDAGHQFVYDDLHRYLAIARTRVDALLARLATR